ncbi:MULTISPECIES: hypothetical protein [Cellulosimicrobium]|uniref:Uncharacterized protein n=2 Tax=Cellulosimicrobium TaxID=157920 RepID=A0AAU8FWT7_9MICO|nr:hypothetical protein [Cellulosimicrobium cellulans]MCO7273256.1 hypothetical protein [Cellulosimicrobium cellulans]
MSEGDPVSRVTCSGKRASVACARQERVIRRASDVSVPVRHETGPRTSFSTMTTTGAGAPLDELCERWRAATFAAGWDALADWAVPAVVHVAAAHLGGRDVTGPARALGIARANAGVGIADGIRDLAVLYSLGGAGLPGPVVAALADGWERTSGMLGGAAAHGSLSGLGTVDDFLSGCGAVVASYRHGREGDVPIVVVVDGRAGSSVPLDRWERDLALGESLRRVFPPPAPACYVDGVALVVAWRVPCEDPDTTRNVVATRVRDELARWTAGSLRVPVRVGVEALPDDSRGLGRLVQRLLKT